MAKKPVRQIPLKKCSVPVAPAEPEETTAAATVIKLSLEGDAVALYNDASAQAKAWDDEKKKYRPAVEQAALNRLYEFNCGAPESCVKTVRVTDGTGSACNVSLSDTYGKAELNPKIVMSQLALLGKADPNVFIAEKVKIAFNTDVFYDAQGELRQEFYLDVLHTMAAIAKEHGVANPFSSDKVISPVDGFAEKRWSEFKLEQQPAVSGLFPATVTIKPMADSAKKE